MTVGTSTTMASSKRFTGKQSRHKHRKWRKPEDKPKHPLSAYNIFFQFERSRMVEQSRSGNEITASTVITADAVNSLLLHQPKLSRAQKNAYRLAAANPAAEELSFSSLARGVADRWKKLDDDAKALFEDRAREDKCRYHTELAEWKRKQTAVSPGSGSGSCRSADVPASPTRKTPTNEAAPTMISTEAPRLVTPEKKEQVLKLALDDERKISGIPSLVAGRATTSTSFHDGTARSAFLPAAESNTRLPPRNLFDEPPDSSPTTTVWPTGPFKTHLGSETHATSSQDSSVSAPMSVRLATKLAILNQRRQQLLALTAYREAQAALSKTFWIAEPSSRMIRPNPTRHGTFAPSFEEVQARGHHGSAAGFTSIATARETRGEDCLDPLSAFKPVPLNSKAAKEADEMEILLLDPHVGLASPCEWN